MVILVHENIENMNVLCFSPQFDGLQNTTGSVMNLNFHASSAEYA